MKIKITIQKRRTFDEIRSLVFRTPECVTLVFHPANPYVAYGSDCETLDFTSVYRNEDLVSWPIDLEELLSASLVQAELGLLGDQISLTGAEELIRYINPLLSVTSENGISYLKDCYSSVSFIREDPHDRVVVNGVALLSDNAAERAKSLSMEERVLVSDLYHEMSRLQMKDAQDVYSAVVVQVAYNLRKSYPVSYHNDLEGYIRDNCSDFLESIEEKVINDLIETDDCNPDVDAITYRAGAIVDDLGQEYEKELAKIAVALLTAEE